MTTAPTDNSQSEATGTGDGLKIVSLPSPFGHNCIVKVLENPKDDMEPILERILSGHYAKPFLLEDGYQRFLHFSFSHVQSAMSISKPKQLQLAYIKAMLSFVLFNSEPKRILLIGLGGGSLARYCYDHYPESTIDVVEINPHVIRFRDEFLLPRNNQRFKIHLGDAADYLRNTHSTFDVILSDVFDRGGFAPSVCTESFYKNLKTRLTRDGVVSINLAGSIEDRYQHQRLLHQVFGSSTLIMPVGSDNNEIALAFTKKHITHNWIDIETKAALWGTALSLDLTRYAESLKAASF